MAVNPKAERRESPIGVGTAPEVAKAFAVAVRPEAIAETKVPAP